MGTTSTAKRFLSARLAVAAALGLGLIIACHTEGSLVRAEWMGAWLWLLPAVAAAEWLRRRRLRRGEETSLPWELWPAAALAVLMVVYLFTSAAYDRHFFFLDWGSAPGWRALMLDSWPGKLMLCTAVLTPLFFFYRRGLWILTFTLLVFSQMRCIHEFVLNTHGTTLYGFDHPSFMHRFWAFGRTFPQLIYYDPFWNGGKAATYLISSGSTALGLLLWPLWKFASIDKVYTPAIGFVFIVLVPFAIAFAVRAARGSWTAAFAAGLLALGVSRHWFIWLLHFGTVSSCLALALAALVGAFLYRVLCLDVRTAATGAGLVVSAFLVVTWPPAGIMLLPPLALAFVAGARQWTARKWVFLLGCGVVVAALFLPYVLGILQRTRVDYYMQGSDEAVQWAEVLKDGLAHVPGYLIASHPLLVFLGFAGAFFVARRAASVYFGAVVLGLLAVAAWGEAIKPELELKRAVLPLCFMAAIPAGFWIADLLESSATRLAPLKAALTVLLVMGGLNSSKFYENKVAARYRLMNQEVYDLVQWVRGHVPAGGRVMFAGSATHAYGGGTVAVLPVLTGHEMMACDYYQFSPRLVEYNYPPSPYRRKAAGILQFAELYNVTHIVTHHSKWITFFNKHTNQFEQVYDFSKEQRQKMVFRVRRDPNQFLQGSGQIEPGINALRVRVDDPGVEVVLKYNWVEGLQADPGVDLRPHPVDEKITLIAAHPHGQKEFRITYRRWF